MITCPACAGELPPQFRFCGYCGTPLEEAAPAGPAGPSHETRRSVTIVFSDLKGSTSLGERLDSEALREVMTRYFVEMSAALERHGGTVEKFIGDAIMAVFGMPVAHEDDALRAVRAALEMKQRLEVLNEELDRRYGVTLANRTGVNTGPVIASGDSTSRQRLVTGDTVNVAARLEQAAPAYEVLIGETTYKLVREAVEVEAVEPLELKGKSERVPAYRLLAVSEVGSPARRHDLPLIGRERELALLTGAFETALGERTCRFVKILAEAGTGKTRLIEELMELSRSHDGLALRGRCLPYGRGITFWPLVEITGAAAGITPDDAPAAARAKIAGLSDDEEVVERVAAAVGLSQRAFPLDELYWGMRRLFEGLAAERPVVVVFEDVHWAESALLDLLSYLGSTAGGAPLVVVCSARHELAERHPDWPLPEGGEELRLGPLAPEAAGALAEHLVGGELPPDVLSEIGRASEGNPLFVEQLVSMFVDEGALVREGQRWVAGPGFAERVSVPASIEALLAARLDLLPNDELVVVESASVVGLVFGREPVAELVPASGHDLGDELARVEARQLVRSHEAPDTFRFHHIMIRDSAYNRLPKRTRSGLHARFAGWAERVNRERGRELEFQEIVGYHLEQARRYLLELAPHDPDGVSLGLRAASHLGPAGRRAFGRGDMWAAVNLLRRTVELLPAGARERLELLPDLGEATMEIGEFAEAQRLLDEALDGARALGDTTLEADAILTRLLVAHRSVEDLEPWRAEVEHETGRLIPLLEQAATPAVLAKAWRMLAFVHGTVCQWRETAAALEHAIASARAAGDGRQLARLSASYVMALSEGPTPTPEAIERTEEVLAFGLVDRQAEAVALQALAQLHAMSGELDRAREVSLRSTELLRDLGATVLATRTSLSSSRIEFIAGDAQAAEAKLREDFDALTAIDERYFRPLVAALLAKALVALERIDEAEELATVAESLSSSDDIEAMALVRSVQANVQAAHGEGDRARSIAREVVELVDQTDSPALRADALLDVAEVLAASPAERIDLLEQARALYTLKQHLPGMSQVDSLLAAAAVG